MRACQGCGATLPPDAHWKRKWCSEKCRRAQYTERQACVDCGQPTSGGARNGYRDEPLCQGCSYANAKVWTREAIILAIQEWADLYGEPPAMPDWNAWQSRVRFGDEERALRWEQSARWPSFKCVVGEFGSWNRGIQAAGFEPRPAHGVPGRHRRQRAAA